MNNLKITFTHYESPEPLSKRYWLENNSIRNQAAAQMVKGTARRITMPFSEFSQVFGELSSNEAFGYGVHPLSLPDKVNIRIKGKENLEKNIISRSQDFYSYAGSGVLMLDHDPSEYGKTLNPKELMSILTKIQPILGQCARIERSSVSASVHLPNHTPSTSKGFHIYMPVLDASLIPAYGALLSQYLWLHGHGHIALAANGAMLKRTCIDGAVFSPERLDFVGEPLISGDGLTYTYPNMNFLMEVCWI